MAAEMWAMIETIPERHSNKDIKGCPRDVLLVAFANIWTAKKGNLQILEYDVILHYAEGRPELFKVAIQSFGTPFQRFAE